MLNLAVRWDYIKDSPIKNVKSLKADDKKPLRFLTTEEIQQFLNHAPKHLYPIYFTLLHTGMRKAEIVNLTWGDVDFKLRKIYIRSKEDWNPKTGERDIPISDELIDVLNKINPKQYKSSKSKMVFNLKLSGHSHNILRRELIKIAQKAEIENFTQVHSLRHTFASHLIMNGVDLPTVQKFYLIENLFLFYNFYNFRHALFSNNELPPTSIDYLYRQFKSTLFLPNFCQLIFKNNQKISKAFKNNQKLNSLYFNVLSCISLIVKMLQNNTVENPCLSAIK